MNRTLWRTRYTNLRSERRALSYRLSSRRNYRYEELNIPESNPITMFNLNHSILTLVLPPFTGANKETTLTHEILNEESVISAH